MVSIVWFRQDLRLADNPALCQAARSDAILPVYILDETAPPEGKPLGGAARWWLHHSLASLKQALGGLVLLRGSAADLLPALAERVGASSVVWNRCYEPYAIARDTALKQKLTERGIEAASFNGSLLFEPWEVQTGSGGPFKVYSPFWRACQRLPLLEVKPVPQFSLAETEAHSERLEDWGLLPTKPNWAQGLQAMWEPGEAGANMRLDAFLETGLEGYAELRNRPDLTKVSRLSPHLHWGEVSPRQIFSAVQAHMAGMPQLAINGEKFLSEIGWREFNYHLLYHFPTIVERNWKPAFDDYPWRDDPAHLNAWQRGRTGYPIVDAGLRELWATGYMHNRVRMVVASFLVKHLRLHWRSGEAWFWDTLVDADLASNVAGWQWTAGSGADAAPYFRIFNPMEQGRKFDPEGLYVRRWCPELARLPTKFIHAPFLAQQAELAAAGVKLGVTYPLPIVDHASARAAALEGYQTMREGSDP